jgi:CubicO group peptidase (beta-lactamase class C family)
VGGTQPHANVSPALRHAVDQVCLTRRELLGLAAALGVSACTPRLLRDPRGADSFTWTLETPEAAGLAPQFAQDLRAVIQKYIDGNQITGAVTAIARNNQLVYFEAQGVSNPETGAPMRKDDLFRMMSATKVVTAVAVLVLLDEGRLSLDDKVSRFVPGLSKLKVAEVPAGQDASQARLVPARREVILKDLLTHTSGLSSGGLPDSPTFNEILKKIYYAPDDTLASYVPRLEDAVLSFHPGSRFSYSPLDGFDVLAHVVEVASGKPVDVFMRERIFEPLDMRDTWFHVPPGEQARIVPLYARDSDRWLVRKNLLDLPPRYVSGAGGLFSTTHDFLNFYLMLLNRGSLNGRRVLKPETVDLMTQNHVGSLFAEWVPAFSAGMGFGLGGRVVLDDQKVPYRGVGSFGWGGAYGTEPWTDPQVGIAGVIMIQQPVLMLAPTFQAALRRSIVPDPG